MKSFSGKEMIISDLRKQCVSVCEIALIYKVNRNTVSSFIRNNVNINLRDVITTVPSHQITKT